MRRGRHAREPEVDPFYDMLFNMLIAFVFCFIVALLAMNPKALGKVERRVLTPKSGGRNDLTLN